MSKSRADKMSQFFVFLSINKIKRQKCGAVIALQMGKGAWGSL